jgi:hypothetical protein
VRRINVVEPDGTLRLVLSDRAEFPGLPLHGKEIPRPDRNDSAGMLFINDEGTEDGGLIYGGKRAGSTGGESFSHLSFDEYDQDQTLVLESSLQDGKRSSGVSVNDAGAFPITPTYIDDVEKVKAMPAGAERQQAWKALETKYPSGPKRGFFGRQPDDSVGMNLRDAQGRVRVELKVGPDGEPVLRFLDAQGKLTREIAGHE